MEQRRSSQSFKRKELVAKLNATGVRAFKAAADTAKLRGNPYVELAHFIQQLVLSERSDVQMIIADAGLDVSRLTADMTRAIDKLPYGATSVEEFSDHIFHAIQEGWNLATLEFGVEEVRSAHILLACLKTPALEGLVSKISAEFDKIDADGVISRFADVTEGSLEAGSPRAAAAAETPVKRGPGGDSALAKYATDLTQRARDGKIDPVVGRDPEIRQIVDILMRRRQNNPILTGEAGVGKTAVVEGFALRIAQGDVPPTLQNVSVRMLDVGLMQAGASVKGEFEKRLKAVIDEVQASEVPIILFIDEAHTLIGAGGAAGTGDAANLLKPALARGELRTIAATTWAEYKQHIEKDPALTRRFQVVKIDEPSEAVAVLMLRGVAGVLEQHHKVQILDEAIEAAVSLSHRYIPARQLPDKAVSLLDTACARVAVSQHATPAEVEDILRRRQALEVESGIIGREAAIGIDVSDRQARVDAGLAETETSLAAAQGRWDREKALVAEILDLRAKLRGEGVPLDEAAAEETAGTESGHGAAKAPEQKAAESKAGDGAAAGAKKAKTPKAKGAKAAKAETVSAEPADEAAADLARLRELMAELAAAQGETPLILPSVDRNAVAAVVQDWTGIPTGRMLSSQTEKALKLAATLSERVVGQDHAMEMIARRVQTSRAGLGAPEKPVGVFLLCGPSGVGKTETALALAETLYGGEQNLISINMSEFQEAHTVSTLKGAPPGYVGYGKGGILTEAVRRKPYSVILLDEVEKAHPDVHEIFFQVFDKGMMDDSEGRRIDFKNTLILLTSNVGSDVIMDRTKNGTVRTGIDDLDQALRAPLLKVFPAAFLGRVVTIPYYPLSDAMIEAIARHQFGKIAKRLKATNDAELVIGDGVMDLVKARCTEIESGGRMIDAILTNTLLPELSRGVLNRSLEGKKMAKVIVGASPEGFTYSFE
ncbi:MULTISPECIES: type VI secretion system ATPase TssH [unclassified Mesorhizobium]|uniref:type VI secretion system ATPase TssH n=1 Tax=unclassified Mesorhizobium TaxID=325217 RepID=UPI000F759034|nr:MULTISPECIES: type VI secretion system ATPase TssH [unclassified Mesorhizobium]AZO05445.1 type VI secretion system ATPase TssH [Mesorhizobium sp. M2A.F.Ca.ET.043.02.1.1]RUW40789.1 type VI secretion system ATPase TssH [Mesorhizobium sp. M2A.F.Ca.ET.015.02.1.1]RVC94149.1 type VI secretion system ATPase TssH [Mesorhizobium sp. M2A.F.Ca.ET.017.03.2.1]RVD10693.1 type VI secretion system ATPase TssH [Mesorhizobium sp. M2A.F.Ca.ET.029.05.1.1]RWB49210.1 MAG: type VI secretion system ATPase TssH [Me